MKAKSFGLFLEGKERDRLALGTCIVGLILSTAILCVHGSGHLLLSYSVLPPQPQVSGAVDAILKVAAERRSLMLELKDALLAHQDKEALRLARKYCGIEASNAD
ncbi:MAG: hypothetical protein WB679_06815 [Terracidiphilus sp.]